MVDFNSLLHNEKVVPIAVVDDATTACKLAELLIEHSFNILEITLRTESASDIIAEVTKRFPELVVGAGSVLDIHLYFKAINAGAKFCVAPGCDEALLQIAGDGDVPFIPGIITPSELQLSLRYCTIIKIFPTGFFGLSYLPSLLAPFRLKEFSVIPTGGVNPENIENFLSLEKVIACGMSYIIHPDLIKDQNFEEIKSRIVKMRAILDKYA